jgi:hypothetical protein
MTDPNPKRRWYQFSLRTLLVLMFLAAIGMSWFAVKLHQARWQREAVEAIGKAGGRVTYGFQITEDGLPVRAPQLPGPAWLRKLLGDDLFVDVVEVQAYGFRGFGDAELEHVEGLKKLRCIYLSETQVTDAGLEHLRDLTRLAVLYLEETQITDAGLERLIGLTNLKELYLDNTQITNAGMKHIEGLTNLEILFLSGTHVTDAGLEHLKGLTKLQDLYILGTQVTDAGIKKLQEALPNCRIMH